VLYFQCKFRRGNERTVAWIEQRGAIVGACVELLSLDDGDAWEVEAVNYGALTAAALKEMQTLNRNSLPSIRA
jgi:hypothetical protein